MKRPVDRRMAISRQRRVLRGGFMLLKISNASSTSFLFKSSTCNTDNADVRAVRDLRKTAWSSDGLSHVHRSVIGDLAVNDLQNRINKLGPCLNLKWRRSIFGINLLLATYYYNTHTHTCQSGIIIRIINIIIVIVNKNRFKVASGIVGGETYQHGSLTFDSGRSPFVGQHPYLPQHVARGKKV